MTYNPQNAAAWIINEFIARLPGQDLDALKRMITADLAYAYQQGRKDALASSGIRGEE